MDVAQRVAQLFEVHGEALAGAARAALGPAGRGAADLQDVLQDGFLRVCRAARDDGIRRDAVGFVFVVVMNAARDRRRAFARRRMGGEEGLVNVPDPTRPPPESAQTHEAADAARAALAELPDSERDVFHLRVGAGLTFEAAAEALGIPVGTAKTRMRAALARLRQRLHAHAPGRAAIETERNVR